MRTLIIVAVIGICTLVVTAQNPFVTGSVSGRVFDADTLSPLAGVRVGSDEIGFVVTDPQGRYILRGLNPGRVRFSIPSGYTSAPWPDKVVTVQAGREISAVDFRYRLDAQIAGRVFDEDGNPVSGARVTAFTRELGPDGEMRYEVAGFGVESVTNNRGEYAITSGVRAGRSYWLLASQLRKYASPISDAPADVSSRRRISAATFYPGADSIETAVPIVPRSLENRVADIRMLKKPAYCLEATLMAGSRSAQMTFVMLEEDRYAAKFRGVPSSGEGGTSGSDGKIRLCDLPPGRYRLAAFPADSTRLRSPTYFNTLPITIVDRDVRDVVVTTLPLATVSGEVVWDSTPSDPALKESIAAIRLDPPPTVPAPPIDVPIPSSFSFAATPGLKYSVRVTNARLYVKDITVGISSILGKSYVPGSEALRITIAHDGGGIRASVTNTSGQPAMNSAVIVLPANAATEVELATTMVEGFTDEDGVFQTRSLRPGRYVVLATDDPPPYVTVGPAGTLNIQRSPEALARLLRARSRGQAVDVGPRATIQVNLTSRTLGGEER